MDKAWRIFALILLVEVHLVYPAESPTDQWDTTTRYPTDRTTGYPWISTTRYPTDRITGYPWISTSRYPTDRTTRYPTDRTTRYPTDRTTLYPTDRTTRYPTYRTTRYPTDRTTRYPTGRKTTPVRQSTSERPYSTTERPYSTTERLDSTTSAESCPDDWIDGGYIGCYKFLDDLSVNCRASTNGTLVSWTLSVRALGCGCIVSSWLPCRAGGVHTAPTTIRPTLTTVAS